METYYHGTARLFGKFDLNHALEGDGKVKIWWVPNLLCRMLMELREGGGLVYPILGGMLVI